MPLAKAYRHRPTGIPVQYLICGGGGAGGRGLGSGRCSGGGGGGQVVTGSQTLTSLTAYPVVIGVGGRISTPPDATNQGFPGGNTTFLGRQGGGGGGGGGGTGEGQPDHNGGFGPPGSTGPGGGGGTPDGAGANGGANANGTNDVAGGGGGDGFGATAPTGANGIVSSITGTATPYGPGGGGGTNLGTIQGGSGGNGGAGGTGAGEFGGALVPTAFGGGGGGASRLGGVETAGRQGVVIVSYDGLTVRASGGVITQALGRTIHTFTANGTFTTI